MNILQLGTCKSTNLEARKICDYEFDITPHSGFMYLNGKPWPNIIVSRKQTQGKGRSGNWFSPEDCGIYMSVIRDTRPNFKRNIHLLKVDDWTQHIGISINKVITDYFQLSTYMAGVNDIYLANRKIAGILCEYHAASDKLIVGVGLNTFRPVKIRKDLINKAVWLNDYAAEYLIDHKKLIDMISEEIIKI